MKCDRHDTGTTLFLSLFEEVDARKLACVDVLLNQ